MAIGNLFILGDSYSTFEGYIPKGYAPYYCPAYPEGEDRSDVKQVEHTWWYQFVQESGAHLVRNCSYSGTTICHTGYGGADCSDKSFIARLDRLLEEGFFEENPIDTFIVFGGTNDSWADAPIGAPKYSDWTREELYSVLPAIGYLMQRIRSCIPQARAICVINTELKDVISEELQAACARTGIETIVLENITKVSGHPTIRGMREIADQILRYLEQ